MLKGIRNEDDTIKIDESKRSQLRLISRGKFVTLN